MQDDLIDHDVEQAALRALNRMGSQKATSPSSNNRRNESEPLRLSSRPTMESTGQMRKRRFVRDGDIPVEHNSFSRSPSRPSPLTSSGDNGVKTANKTLENEKRARQEAERQVHELEAAQRSLETRLGHAEVLVSELKQALATRDMELADRNVELRNERAAMQQVLAEMRELRQKAKKSPRQLQFSDDALGQDEEGQQPVKWWKD